MTGKQRVATAVFSQHHHDKMVLHSNLACMPVRPCSSCMRNAPAAPWTQCWRASKCKCFVRALYCMCKLQSWSVGLAWVGRTYFFVRDITSMTDGWIDNARLRAVWGSHMNTIKWGSLTLTQWSFQCSHTDVSSLHRVVLEQPYWRHWELLSEVEGLDLDQLVHFADSLLSDITLLCFAHGNLDQSQVSCCLREWYCLLPS